ncbi:hypothetical protein DEU56DRAFT_981789 [Suillus clintonianus]|uniref:uncharacterized protein n=1 Tax=Suillus clintonianus TaxID=1904413 RepID=UPI001B873E76|nr:uncharacterized protein DEU56DRAFT_981789 [Suillus clintonianus]KAG2132109.1 hypothetical protein DEU56DRAFT_981789 [Suillus clintonianus]
MMSAGGARVCVYFADGDGGGSAGRGAVGGGARLLAFEIGVFANETSIIFESLVPNAGSRLKSYALVYAGLAIMRFRPPMLRSCRKPSQTKDGFYRTPQMDMTSPHPLCLRRSLNIEGWISHRETFIVVRPPPSKSNHPLNLQVQLVPPQSRHDRPHATVQALDQSAPDTTDSTSDSTDLRRKPSGQSETSTASAYTSATSISSFTSLSTTSSGRRMIIPLYNLQAHNVMTNVIVDAGTDAKAAKFAERGLRILGLAILVPIRLTL